MKKTAIAIATMTLVLVGTTLAQPRQRPTRQIGNPIGLGGTVTAGIKQTPNQDQRTNRKIPTSQGDQPELQIANSPQQNLGDTGTHEVGHKGNRRPMPKSINLRKRIDKGAPVANIGDTATHEVGHKGKLRNGQFRPTPSGDGTTQQFRKSGTSEQNRTNQPLSRKLGDIAGENKVARTETVTNNEFKSKRPYIGGSDDGSSIRGKNPRQRNNQKRQHLPCKGQDCK